MEKKLGKQTRKQIGVLGIIGIMLAGYSWRYPFFIYGLGFLALFNSREKSVFDSGGDCVGDWSVHSASCGKICPVIKKICNRGHISGL